VRACASARCRSAHPAAGCAESGAAAAPPIAVISGFVHHRAASGAQGADLMRQGLNRTATLLTLLLSLCWAMSLSAQETSSSNMEILREKVSADKKLLIASNMNLTEEEAKAFWPIYADYQKDQRELYRRLGEVIRAYAEEYNAGSLTDEKAAELMNAAMSVDEKELALTRAYMKKLDGALPTVKAVRYLQMERKIRNMLRYDISSQVPLVR
jgi:Spy/CpxP family protein refolding chaperone